jgi:hypothetical protein
MAYEIPIQAVSFPSTAAVIQYRCVVLTSGGGVKPSTGQSTAAGWVRVIGVAQDKTTGAGRIVPVLHQGVTKVAASTKAIKVGQYLRATSGAASTATNLGGTVRPTTSDLLTYAIGQALSSCAAAAAGNQRLIAMRLL